MAAFVVGPPCVQQYVGERIRGGGPKCLKICSKNHFLSNSRCNAGPDFNQENLDSMIAEFNNLNLSDDLVWAGGYAPVEGQNQYTNRWKIDENQLKINENQLKIK